MANQLSSEPVGPSSISTAPSAAEEFHSDKRMEVERLRKELMGIVGAGRGAEAQKIIDKLMSLHPRVEADPEQKGDLEEAAVKKFLRRPGLPPKEIR
jgi:hypothetical protein